MIKPDIFTYHNILTSLIQHQEYKIAQTYLDKLVSSSLKLETISYNIILNLYGSMGNKQMFNAFLTEMRNNNVRPNFHTEKYLKSFSNLLLEENN